jgi:hypothetical protein
MKAAPSKTRRGGPFRNYPDLVICETGSICFVRTSVIPSPPFYIA